MLLDFVIGHLGGDAIVRSSNGREFTTIRIAHSERWASADGTRQERTEWVDAIIDGKPNVLPWLKRGQLVAVVGTSSLRVYSSPKDKCMKAGRTINVIRTELIGASNSDAVPSQLYDESGAQHNVTKFYATDCPGAILMSRQGEQYAVDDNGWVVPLAQVPAADDPNQDSTNAAE